MTENQLQQKIAEFEHLEKLISTVSDRIDVFSDQIDKCAAAMVVLSQANTQDEQMIQIIDGIFIPVKITDTSKCVISVGSNAAVEKSAKDTITLLEEQQTVAAEYKQKLIDQLTELSKRVDEVQSDISRLEHV